MGRDDRCIGGRGKEGRYPYLDEEVVSFLRYMREVRSDDERTTAGANDGWSERRLERTTPEAKRQQKHHTTFPQT